MMGAMRNLLELLGDLVRGLGCPRPGCDYRPSWADVRHGRRTEGLMHHVALEHPDIVEELHAKLLEDDQARAMAKRRRIELGVALVNPDDIGFAHRPDDVEPLEVTWCGLSRRRFAWTMPVSEVPAARRCPACFPAPTPADV